MSAPWYYIEGGERCGPISTIELKKRVSKGQVKKSSPVRREGFAGWITAGSVPGLFDAYLTPKPESIPTSQLIAQDAISISSEQSVSVEQKGISSGRWMHAALWSTVAFVALTCGCLVWSHEAEKGFKAQIVRLCQEVQSAIRKEDDEAAELAYERLTELIMNREIPWKSIASEVKKTQRKYLPVEDRLDQAREALALAEAKKRADAEEKRRLTEEAAIRSTRDSGSPGLSSWEEVQLELIAQKYGMTLSEAKRMYEIQGKLDSGQSLTPDERSFRLSIGIKIMK